MTTIKLFGGPNDGKVMNVRDNTFAVQIPSMLDNPGQNNSAIYLKNATSGRFEFVKDMENFD